MNRNKSHNTDGQSDTRKSTCLKNGGHAELLDYFVIIVTEAN